MPLKTYQKSVRNIASVDIYSPSNRTSNDQITLRAIDSAESQRQKPKVSMWSLLVGTYGGLKQLVATSSAAGLVVPALFITVGVFVIYQQFQPVIAQQLKESVGYYDQGTKSLVQEDSYIAERLKYVSNPGSDYFKELEEAFAHTTYKVDERSKAYNGTLYLSVPSLGFDRLPIEANVDSGVKEAYDSVLNSKLAHFKGTNLPFAENKNNIVLYGHSASGSYNPSPSDVLAAFSFLPDLKVGDLIILEQDGLQYKYKMARSKIVEPDDSSIISGTPGKDTLTIFTCYPNGNNSHRYVAIAQPVLD